MADVAQTTADAGKPKRRFIAVFGRAWFWFSTVTSVIGLISIVEDLKLWVAAATKLLAWARSLAPAFADALIVVGGAIHVVLEIFRGVFRPLFDLLPFQVPEFARDAVVVFVFVGLGLLRVTVRSERDAERADATLVRLRGEVQQRLAPPDSPLAGTAPEAWANINAGYAAWRVRINRFRARWTRVVWVAAGITAILVALDAIFMR